MCDIDKVGVFLKTFAMSSFVIFTLEKANQLHTNKMSDLSNIPVCVKIQDTTLKYF